MALFGWSGNNLPFLELERMRNHMDNIYNSLVQGVNKFRKNYTGVFPLVNLSEDDENLYLSAELPGVAADQLNISVKGDTLTLRGEVQAVEGGAEVNYHRREREGGQFRRSLTLPVKVDADNISASFKNGVLNVVLPKAPEAKARQISIKAE